MSAAATTTTGTTPGSSGRIPVGSLPGSLGGRLRERGRALVLGRRGALVWERPALLGLLAVTAVLYIWNLGASGYANSFYSAAVQAGSVNWEAFFYGSSDAANSITVDKPPASLWFMALSVRLFGLSSWSILLPEAIMGVVTVAIVYATVRRRFSAPTALLAGGVLAITPVAALMFRFNNPDALLVLLLSLATYFTIRGVEDGRIRWVLWAGAMIGFGFLTKQLQAFVLLPPLALVYLWAAPRTFRVRLLHSLAALGAVIVSAGWWVAIVELVPESWRPYIGGSQTNSFLELTFGYNGFGRLTGNETGSVTGGGGGTTGGGMWGSTGITRLFDGEIGGQITWLLPAALVVGVIALVLLRRAPRTSVRRAILVIFGAWMLVTGLAFSFMAGIFHAYYTVALAPAIAAVVAIGATMLWERRSALWARVVLAAVLLGTAGWAYALLTRASDWMPWLKFVVVALAVVGAVLLVLPPLGRRIAVATAAVSLIGALAAPAAYSLQTVSEGHTGSIVTAGPSVSGGMGGFGGGRGGGGFGGGQGGTGGPGGGGQGGGGFPGSSQNGTSNGSTSSQGFGGTPPQGFGQNGGGSSSTGGSSTGGTTTGGTGGGFGPQGGTSAEGATGTRGGGMGGGAGGLLGASSVSTKVEALLKKNASDYTWAAATIGSNSAAGYQLATELPVMPIGGFNGSDPSPTLAEFQALVKKGEIHYFIASGVSGRSNGGSDAASSITAWVEENYTATTVDGVTLYDLS